MTHPFGLTAEQADELWRALDRMAEIARMIPVDLFGGEHLEEFLRLQARVNDLVPPGTMP